MGKVAHRLALGKQSAVCRFVACERAEELGEVEIVLVAVVVVLKYTPQIIGAYIEVSQPFVWILLVGMVESPLLLGFLFLYVVPSVDFLRLELVEYIIGCTREVEETLASLFELMDNRLPQGCLCALVRLVDND